MLIRLLRSGEFPLGRFLATPGALLALDTGASDLKNFLIGTLTAIGNANENEISLQSGLRLLSSYTTVNGKQVVDHH